MSSHRDELRAWADRTKPDAALLDRVGARLRAPAGGSAWPLRARVATVALGVAAAAAVLGWPRSAAEPVQQALEGPGTLDVAGTRLRWDGQGTAGGTTEEITIAWQIGTLAVQVGDAPVLVTTDEGSLRAARGSSVEVTRDAFGTRLVVGAGGVTAACAGEEGGPIGSDAERECLPITPAALLGRARAQSRRGDAGEAILATLDRARAGAAGPVVAEVELLRVSELTRLGREEEALAAAEAALANGGEPRRAELLRAATSLAVAMGGCERAQTHADALRALGEEAPCSR
jgi:hypothetical protein